jgi:hypothetical protein
MSDGGQQRPRLPPRWFVRLAWSMHRGLYRVTGGRVGLWRPRANRSGTLHLTTTGRRTGRKRGRTRTTSNPRSVHPAASLTCCEPQNVDSPARLRKPAGPWRTES